MATLIYKNNFEGDTNALKWGEVYLDGYTPTPNGPYELPWLLDCRIRHNDNNI